jgi:hypothetical protein
MSPTYEEFAKSYKSYCATEDGGEYLSDSVDLNNYFIYDCAEIGGYFGGNCWGDEAEPYYVRDPKWDDSLKSFLLDVVPKISLVHVDELQALQIEGYDEVYEYYGNSAEYKYLKIPLKTVYDKLIEWSYI